MATQQGAGGGEAHKVSITRTVTVHSPLQTNQNSTLLSLSNLDRQCPVLMYLIYFYKPPPQPDMSVGSLFENLKMGLEEILSVWYPASGRLCLNPNTGKLDILCNNGGAVLVEAVTDAKISDLGDLSQYKRFYEELVYKPELHGMQSLSDMPLVVSQANFDFLLSWACKTARRGVRNLEVTEPIHRRDRLLVKNQHQKEIRVLAFDHLHQLIQQAVQAPNLDDVKFGEEVVLRTFHVGCAKIEDLKQKVMGGQGGIAVCSSSSFEVVAAHLWKARTKALKLSTERLVCLQFAVDARTKMVPPLPKSFSGNAFVLASIACSAGALEDETLQSIVAKIKVAKAAVTESYVRSYLEALEAMPTQGSPLPPLPELTIVSDWTRNPYHTVDFGIGRAAYVAPMATPVPRAAYFMQGTGEVGGVDVRVGLESHSLLAFCESFV
ncbi:Anthranilate N-benzoyltransferase protein 1 [Acorus calamus]|uniref:Anthranilate N-benzoyltransferase protein 1 n=1 Tax=Acorus calamus TaxID=4465 RepID=A0AAV9CHP7_ACOCL|nr:Anthranilate N-benzoyltransferase protein 1 [Acorus calamus]